jgi:hypothetical protein
LAVEVHQNATTSSDLIFDFGLDAAVVLSNAPTITAQAGLNSITLAWRAELFMAVLWTTTNLSSPVVWISASNTAAFTNGAWQMLLPGFTNASRFYRLELR